MIIRKANYNDASVLNNFLTLLIRDEKKYDDGINENFVVQDMYENYIDDNNKLIIVSIIDEQIVGYLYGMLIFNDDTYKYSIAKLDALYVMENYRGKKVATSLINYFKEWASKMGAYKIEVNVWSNNVNAKKLYESVGFKKACDTLNYFL